MDDPWAAYGGEWATRMSDPATAEAAAQANAAPLIAAIRRAGATKSKLAYRAGLSDAAERGVAFNAGPGTGVSGMAEQEIQPRVQTVEADTEQSVMNAINEERQRIEERRQREQDRQATRDANSSRGLLAGWGL